MSIDLLDRTLRSLRLGRLYREARPLPLQQTLRLCSKMPNLIVENFHISIKRSLEVRIDVQFRLRIHQKINFPGHSLSIKDGLEGPTVLTSQEIERIFSKMEGVYALMARLLYGTGMRLMECAQLRVKDVDFQRREKIREGKGG